MQTNQLVAAITEAVIKQLGNTQTAIPGGSTRSAPVNDNRNIPVGVSNRHVHLAHDDLARLFGAGFQLTKLKDLSQPGQFACEQKVTLVGPGGVLENVRILGPTRNHTQIEISIADGFKLGVKAPIRDSGDLAGSAGVTLVGPVGSITLKKGTIIAARHIHMHTTDATQFGFSDGDRVSVKVPGPRGLIFNEVLVRISGNYKLEMHVDVDEANAAFLGNNDFVEIIRPR